MNMKKSNVLQRLHWKLWPGRNISQHVFNLIIEVLSTAFLVQVDWGKTQLHMTWSNQPQVKIYLNFLARNRLWFHESHRGICIASTQSWTCRPLWTVYSHVEISCHCLSSVFLKNTIYAVCWCTENCFQGISPLQFEMIPNCFVASWLDIAIGKLHKLFVSTEVAFLCVRAQEKE